jgi:hypothetical protein
MLRVATFVFALGAVAAAQAPDVERLRKDLGGKEARDVAWAAHRARSGKHKELIAPLQRALGTWRRDPGPDRTVVCQHLLDALIALDAKVPAGELMDLVETDFCGAAAFVLLAREPRTNEAELLAMFRRDFELRRSDLSLQRDRRTVVIGDLLAWQAPPGFVEIVAPECSFELLVITHDPGNAPRKPAILMAANGMSAREPTEGWPPEPTYWIEHPDMPRSAAEVVLIHRSLPHAVTRQDTPPKKDDMLSFRLPETGGSTTKPLPLPMRWLVAAAGTAQPVLETPIAWQNDAQFLVEAEAARARLQACLDEMRTRLVNRKTLTAEAAAQILPAHIAVKVTDQRTAPKTHLPILPAAR